MVDLARRGLFLGKAHSSEAPIRMPWLVDEATFTQTCTRCGDCLAACPEHIIVKGSGGFPQLSFSQGECTFCAECVNVCTQPLFQATDNEPWHQSAQIDTTLCMTFNGVMCRSCEDSCEPIAIRFRPALGGIAQPAVNLDSCNGCGACIRTCPTQAISVKRSQESRYAR